MKNVSNVMLFVALTCLTISMSVFAQGFPIPEGDITQLIIQLASDPKAIGTLAGISTLIMLSVQLIKKLVSDEWKYKRLLTLFVAILFSISSELLLAEGINWIAVIVKVFIGAGGASALYEALKGAGIIKKKAALTLSGVK